MVIGSFRIEFDDEGRPVGDKIVLARWDDGSNSRVDYSRFDTAHEVIEAITCVEAREVKMKRKAAMAVHEK